jgi:hypothetical protein
MLVGRVVSDAEQNIGFTRCERRSGGAGREQKEREFLQHGILDQITASIRRGIDNAKDRNVDAIMDRGRGEPSRVHVARNSEAKLGCDNPL